VPALSRRQTAGIVAACASSMLGGTAVVVTRILVEQVDPLTLAALRYGLGAACLVPLVLLARLRLPDRRDLLPIAGLGFIFFALFVWLFNTALGWTTASHGALALSTMPFLTLIVVSLFRAEPMRLVKLMGVLCAATGVAVALSGKADGTPPGAWRGDLMMVGAAGCGALYNVLSQP
jgi:drug/metabolite transporter (DMT)-like permease